MAAGGRGLDWFEVVVPDEGTLAAVQERLVGAGAVTEERSGGIAVTDPDGIAVRTRSER